MKLKTFCWKCGWHTNEWLTLKIWIQRRGKCFYCRIDDLDAKYGPSLTAELNKTKDGEYLTPYPTKWELRKWKREILKKN